MKPFGMILSAATVLLVLIIFSMFWFGIKVQITEPKYAPPPAPVPVSTPIAPPAPVNQIAEPAPTDCNISAVNSVTVSLPVTNLPDLIVAALPAKGFDSLDWDYMVDSPIISWQTLGTNSTEGGWTCRQGLARISVAGVESKILLQKWNELAWSISLWTSGNEKFGPKWIEIKPGGDDPNSMCFGSNVDGCTFTATQALASPLLQSHLLCSPAQLGGETQVYSVLSPNKEPSLVVYEASWGSGGEQDTIQIRPLSDTSQSCQSS